MGERTRTWHPESRKMVVCVCMSLLVLQVMKFAYAERLYLLQHLDDASYLDSLIRFLTTFNIIHCSVSLLLAVFSGNQFLLSIPSCIYWYFNWLARVQHLCARLAWFVAVGGRLEAALVVPAIHAEGRGRSIMCLVQRMYMSKLRALSGGPKGGKGKKKRSKKGKIKSLWHSGLVCLWMRAF